MNAAAWCFAVAFGIALVIHFIIRGELDRLYAERAALREDNDRQADLIAELQSGPDAEVLDFGPVQSGVVKRIPRQRNGDAS